MASGSFLTDVEDMVTPDFLRRASQTLNLSTESIQKSLQAVIPTFLMGVFNKGSSSEGAKSLVNMVDNDSIAASDIFGSSLDPITSRVASMAGVPVPKISKLFTMVTPLVMGVLGSKITQGHLTPAGLMDFFRRQKPVVANLVPEGILPTTISGPRVSAALWILPLALLALAVWLFAGHRPVSKDVITMAPASEVAGFLQVGSTIDLPRRFRFNNLRFESASAILVPESETELNGIAQAMKDHPQAKAKIEGFTDETGTIETNQRLSQERADNVKADLVVRGIDPERIEAVGMGNTNPIAANDTDLDRAENRRIEFVVIDL